MDFHLEFSPKQLPALINHKDAFLLVGSCFTENIGTKLKQHKFSVLENPNGILFNPASIAKSITSYIDNKQYALADLFYQNECWNSWEHHSRFSHPDKDICLENINRSQQDAHGFLQKADWLLVTVGSAFVYELDNKEVVANCHKVPTDKFVKRLLPAAEVMAMFQNMLSALFLFNQDIKVIFTISPVRHLRDGFVENNRSKANLIQAIHQLVDNNTSLFYFPAYELVIDDLRDYRFYAEDMVHPNYAATNYVWEKFINTCIDTPSQKLMKELYAIYAAWNHKPFNQGSVQHRKFLQANLEKTIELKKQYAYLDFDMEQSYFSQTKT